MYSFPLQDPQFLSIHHFNHKFYFGKLTVLIRKYKWKTAD